MDSQSYRALHAALLGAHDSVTEQLVQDLERRGMAAEDRGEKQRRQMHRAWQREWELLTDLAQPLVADAIVHGRNEEEIWRRIEEVVLDVFEPFLDEILLWEYKNYVQGELLGRLQGDLRAGRLADLEHYLRYYQEEFLAYYRDTRHMAGHGPVHARWTPDGPAPKRRRL